MIAEKAAERQQTACAYRELWDRAANAGDAAAEARAAELKDGAWAVMDGRKIVGSLPDLFASGYVHLGPANRGFGKWAISAGRASKHYYGGAAVYLPIEWSSVVEARASAMADTLRAGGVSATYSTRLD